MQFTLGAVVKDESEILVALVPLPREAFVRSRPSKFLRF